MSEYINNNTQRQELLKDILKGLHEGQPLEQVKSNFSSLVKIADAGEIAQAEQMLIAEGMPVSEIQNLCDLHVEVMRESLNQQKPPESTPGHPIFTFLAENQAIGQLLPALHQSAEAFLNDSCDRNKQNIQTLLSALSDFDKHYLRKENLLFPILERYSFSGPSQVMWGIHNQIRSTLRNLNSMLGGDASLSTAYDPQALRAAFESLEVMTREMIYKENKILFPAALEYLNEEDWFAIRSQESEIGYFMVQPGTEWKPARQVILEEENRALQPKENQSLPDTGLIGLETGALTAEQVNLLLTNLPVDVTFVDENDEVRFFSQTKERIFGRSPAIIGRKVQKCHPPQSLDKVQHILDDFRSGKRDTAEFWIQMKEHFIHIRYFALHDADGKYRGTMEVSQDASGIRALQGERRLLDE